MSCRALARRCHVLVDDERLARAQDVRAKPLSRSGSGAIVDALAALVDDTGSGQLRLRVEDADADVGLRKISRIFSPTAS
jgi:hypothetical protein